MPAVAEIGVREAVLGDLPRIAAVALATGQDEEWGGAGAAYVTHLLAHGQVVVGVRDSAVVGFGATRPIGRGPGNGDGDGHEPAEPSSDLHLCGLSRHGVWFGHDGDVLFDGCADGTGNDYLLYCGRQGSAGFRHDEPDDRGSGCASDTAHADAVLDHVHQGHEASDARRQ